MNASVFLNCCFLEDLKSSMKIPFTNGFEDLIEPTLCITKS